MTSKFDTLSTLVLIGRGGLGVWGGVPLPHPLLLSYKWFNMDIHIHKQSEVVFYSIKTTKKFLGCVLALSARSCCSSVY